MNQTLSSFAQLLANMLPGWKKRDKVLEALEDAERRSYEYAAVGWDRRYV